jgi:hypothetical protein
MNDIRELNDAELEAISGGMTCQAAKAAYGVHMITGDILQGMGRYTEASYFYGVAQGVIDGGCKK